MRIEGEVGGGRRRLVVLDREGGVCDGCNVRVWV